MMTMVVAMAILSTQRPIRNPMGYERLLLLVVVDRVTLRVARGEGSMGGVGGEVPGKQHPTKSEKLDDERGMEAITADATTNQK